MPVGGTASFGDAAVAQCKRSLANPGDILAGSRTERITDDIGLPAAELLRLFRASFGGADSIRPANQRWLLWTADGLVGHVAVQRRWFVVDQKYREGGVKTARLPRMPIYDADSGATLYIAYFPASGIRGKLRRCAVAALRRLHGQGCSIDAFRYLAIGGVKGSGSEASIERRA